MRCVITAAVPLALFASLSAVQPAGQTGASGREAGVPFKVGETLTYDVTWSSYLVAGTATATVTDKRQSSSSTAYVIVAEGRPLPVLARLFNLYYKMDTLLDSVTLLPQRGSLLIEAGDSRRLATTRFDRPARKAFYEVQETTTLKAEVDVPPQVQDGLSALYVLRAMSFKPGETFTLPVIDDGSMYSARMEVVGSENVRVPIGPTDAWNVKISITDAEGQPAASNTAVWISNDARRLPVKLQAELPVGNFVLVLRDVR
jgi:hypothetical protein